MEKYFSILMRKAVGKQILCKFSYEKIDGAALSLMVEAFSFIFLKFLRRVNRATLFAKRGRTTVVDLMNIIELYNYFIDFDFNFTDDYTIHYTYLREFDHRKKLPPVHTYEKTTLDIDYNMRENQIKRRQKEGYLVKKNLLKVIEKEEREKKVHINFIFE